MDNAEAIKRIKDHIRVHHIGEYPHIKIAEALNMALSALATDNNVGDKVEVIRCKDCKHWSMGYCNHFAYYSYEPMTNEDGFCSYGERKDNV